MPRPQPWAPAGHGHQREVEWGEAGHLAEEIGIAGEVDGRPIADDEAERLTARPADRPAAGGVNRAHRFNADAAHLSRVAGPKLVGGESGPLEQGASSERRDDRRPAGETAQRA